MHNEITNEDLAYMLANAPKQIASLNRYIHSIINYRIWEKDGYYLIEECHGTFASGRGTEITKIKKEFDIIEKIKQKSENGTGWLEETKPENYFKYVWNGKRYEYIN